jgi:NTE family protein
MKISLALSGGGTRGIAHLGVIKALMENGIAIDKISGVSSGAILGAFISAEYHPDEVLDIILKTKLFKYLRPGIKSTGLLNLEYTSKLFHKYFKEDSFEHLRIPLTVSALSLRTGRIKYFDSGPLNLPLLASSSIPMLFNPIKINGEQYVDGGLAENLPVNPLKGLGNFIVGVHSNPINPDPGKLTVRSYIERILLITINNNAQHSLREVDFVVEPDELKRVRWSDYSKAKEIFEMGYGYTKGILEELKKKVQLKSRS